MLSCTNHFTVEMKKPQFIYPYQFLKVCQSLYQLYIIRYIIDSNALEDIFMHLQYYINFMFTSTLLTDLQEILIY